MSGGNEMDVVGHRTTNSACLAAARYLLVRRRSPPPWSTATIYIPCDGPIESIGRIRPYQSPEVELATIVHAGSHRSIDLAYGALATHVAHFEIAADGPLREHYLVGPLDTSDENAWRTEIGWPIIKAAEHHH
jgi:hypothetical protein